MTTTMPLPTEPGAETAADRAVRAATAVTKVLPAVSPMHVGAPQSGVDLGEGVYAAAAITRLVGTTDEIALLVGPDLVSALSFSPLPGLDLAAALQPALDAAAASLGTAVEAARQVELDQVTGLVGAEIVAVPLVSTGSRAAVLFPAHALGRSTAPTTFVPDLDAAALGGAPVAPRGIEMLHGIDMELTVELGRTRMTVRELLALSPGDVLELDRAAGSPADLLVNGRLIARGEVVVVDEDFGLRLTEIVDGSAG
jgi:flagellar motor switch protein FliN/FliY